jgi:hypothetical protein
MKHWANARTIDTTGIECNRAACFGIREHWHHQLLTAMLKHNYGPNTTIICEGMKAIYRLEHEIDLHVLQDCATDFTLEESTNIISCNFYAIRFENAKLYESDIKYILLCKVLEYLGKTTGTYNIVINTMDAITPKAILTHPALPSRATQVRARCCTSATTETDDKLALKVETKDGLSIFL